MKTPINNTKTVLRYIYFLILKFLTLIQHDPFKKYSYLKLYFDAILLPAVVINITQLTNVYDLSNNYLGGMCFSYDSVTGLQFYMSSRVNI